MTSPFVSYSEIKLARKCPKAWDYRYRQFLRRRRPRGRPAFIGTILHDMLDALVKTRLDDNYPDDPWTVHERYKTAYAKLWKEEQEEFGDVPLVSERIFEGYMRRYRKEPLIYEASEVELLVPFMKGITLRGYLDKIARDIEGRRFVMDHKFHRILPGPQERFSDIQTVVYLWGWNETHDKDEQLDGVIWDYGRMKAPAIPELLKKGGLSQRANIDTDWFTYQKAIKANGLHIRDYSKMANLLAGKERTFFERVVLPAPSKHLIKTVLEDARGSTKMVRSLGKDAPRHMSGFNCSTCDYRTLCEAEVRGLDAKFVRKKDYVIEKPEGEKKDGADEFQEAA